MEERKTPVKFRYFTRTVQVESTVWLDGAAGACVRSKQVSCGVENGSTDAPIAAYAMMMQRRNH